MAIHRQESCHLIAVSALTDRHLETVLHGDLFAAAEKPLNASEVEREMRNHLLAFRQSALAAACAEYGSSDSPLVVGTRRQNGPQQ